MHRPDLINLNRWLPALVGPVCLRSFNASLLALSDEASFEFSDHPENGETLVPFREPLKLGMAQIARQRDGLTNSLTRLNDHGT